MRKDIFKSKIFNGKTIIVAGASSGIGRSVSEKIAKLNGNVILISRRAEKLKAVATSINKSNNQNHYYYSCDLANYDLTLDLFQKIKKNHKPIDGIVWAAGSELIKITRLTTKNDIHNTFGTIYNGLLSAAKIFCSNKFWSDSGGTMVLISSVSSIRSNNGMLVYSTAKASLKGALKSLSLDLSKYKTRINSILLGAVETEMHNRITKNFNDKILNDYKNKHLFGFGKVDDITPMVIFLLSEGSSWMTGSEITLDGGFTAN